MLEWQANRAPDQEHYDANPCVLAACGRFCAAVVCPAATARGAVQGTVSDTDGIALSKAAVQLTNPATNATFSTTSGPDGHYSIPDVPQGTYTLSSSVPGMRAFQRAGLVVAAGQTVQADIRIADINSNTAGEDRAFYAGLYNPPDVPSGPAPRMADGKPDLSGVWRPALSANPPPSEPLPWAAALIKVRTENFSKDNPSARCLPEGMQTSTTVGPFKLVQTPSLLLILFDFGDPPRQIFLDGRGHPPDPNPTWAGHSIGNWESDVLVVDTIGFNDKAWLFGRDPHTERLRTIERFHRLDAGHLEIQTTFDDPGTYANPWTTKRVFPLAPKGEDLLEFICNENNKDVEHMVGK